MADWRQGRVRKSRAPTPAAVGGGGTTVEEGGSDSRPSFEIPSSNLEIPSWDFENRASKMADWGQGRVRKSRAATPAATEGGGTTVEEGGSDSLLNLETPSSNLGIPSWDFENRASKMADWGQGRVRKSRAATPAATEGGGKTVEEGGSDSHPNVSVLMELTSFPFSNSNQEEEYCYDYSLLQEPDTHGENSLYKMQKLDELDEEHNSMSQILDMIDLLDHQEIPDLDFENRASKMEGWEQGRGRRSRTPTPAGGDGGGAAVEEDGSSSQSNGRGGQRRLWVKERAKEWWKYHDSDECSENEFRKAFRMSKSTFNMICCELGSFVTKKNTALRMAIPVRQRVAVCIYRLATGDPLRTVSALFGLGISTCHKLVLEVCDAIVKVLRPKFLQWPSQERLNKIKSGFRSISGIPDVGGSIYTTHISIIAPKTNPESYFNRKHADRNHKPSYSTTIQGVVDTKGVFIDVCIGYPGSMSDNQILEESALSHRFNMGLLKNTWIVGNSGYPLKDWILVPYTHPNLTWGQHSFNSTVGKVENIAKKAFMRLKGRWGCLQKRIEVKLQELPTVLGACCVLHNICEMNNEEVDVDLRFDLYDDKTAVTGGDKGVSVNALKVRDNIAHNLLHRIHGGSVFRD